MKLAAQTNGVIINCDSMQLYNGLPTLTAQPTAEDKSKIPHKLYGVLAPNDVCSAGNWRHLVLPVIEETLQNNQTPIICGGTGLYIKALIDGLSPIPDIPDEVRQKVINSYNSLGAEKFYAELERRDPVMAKRFHANHKARLMRTMEVLEHTGKSLAEWQNAPRIPAPENWEFEIHKIMPERETLYQRCNSRFIEMIQNGAIQEAEHFASLYPPTKNHIPLNKALGYPQILQHLNGDLAKDEMISLAQGETRRYAKRQVTWFRTQI